MKIDTEPENNRKALEDVSKSSVRFMPMFKPGFWYFFGGIFILFGLAAIFTKEGTFKSSGNLTQLEAGLLSLAIGSLAIGLCKLVLHLNAKLKQHQPRENKGNEWES